MSSSLSYKYPSLGPLTATAAAATEDDPIHDKEPEQQQ